MTILSPVSRFLKAVVAAASLLALASPAFAQSASQLHQLSKDPKY